MHRLLAGMACSLALVAAAAVIDDDGAGAGRSLERASAQTTTPEGPATSEPPPPPVTEPVPVTEAVPGYAEVVDEYLRALAEARWADAYVHLCARATAAVSPDAFAQELAEYRRRQPLLEGEIDDEGPATATNVVVHVVMSLGSVGSQVFIELTRDDPSAPWRLCNVNGGVGEGAVWPEVLDPDERRP